MGLGRLLIVDDDQHFAAELKAGSGRSNGPRHDRIRTGSHRMGADDHNDGSGDASLRWPRANSDLWSASIQGVTWSS
jgi:hypothetical protein